MGVMVNAEVLRINQYYDFDSDTRLYPAGIDLPGGTSGTDFESLGRVGGEPPFSPLLSMVAVQLL